MITFDCSVETPLVMLKMATIIKFALEQGITTNYACIKEKWCMTFLMLRSSC